MRSTVFRGIDALPHGWQVLASLLITGSITAISYGLSKAGLAEVAGTGLSMYAVFVFQRLFVQVARARRGGHFQGSRAILAQFQADWSAFMADRSTLAIFILGVPVTLAYLALRSVCIGVLGVFGNIWFALGFGLLFGAAVASPVLFRDLGRLVAAGKTDERSTTSEAPAPAPVGGARDEDASEVVS